MDEAGGKIIRPAKILSKPSAAVKELLEACPQVSSSVVQRTNVGGSDRDEDGDEEVSAMNGATASLCKLCVTSIKRSEKHLLCRSPQAT